MWEGAYRRLLEDPSFEAVVRRIGPVQLAPPMESPFFALTRSIIYQQLAGAAARTIHDRFLGVVNGSVTPPSVLRVDEESLRGAGLSKSKARAIRDLAAKVESGDVVLDGIERYSDEEIEEQLTKVWGVGRWTARMFLLFQLRRPDVWPVGDLGVREGFRRVLQLDDRPSADELRLMGVGFRPWRSAVAWYCWRAVDQPGTDADG